MKALYNIGILIFTALAYLISPFNSKASLWIKGRKGWTENIRNKIKSGDRTMWIHCASLGEFEQGRPVIEAIKKEISVLKIVLTFFSPSGYEVQHNYTNADFIYYLPADTIRNARRFIKYINPEVVFFIKYEYWYNFLTVLKKKSVPVST